VALYSQTHLTFVVIGVCALSSSQCCLVTFEKLGEKMEGESGTPILLDIFYRDVSRLEKKV
jgi:hypothetical protein